MKNYSSNEMRNIVIVGHSTSGKTILADSILYSQGVINRIGSITEGTTISDYSKSEIEKQISMSSSLMHFETNELKFNIIDTPGYMDFAGEVISSVHVSDIGILSISATAGIEVGTEFSWNYLRKAGAIPLISINMLDKEHTHFDEIVEKAKERFTDRIFPIQFPVKTGPGMDSVIDLVLNKMLVFDNKGKYKKEDIPAEYKEKTDELYQQMIEMIAESDDELLEIYFDKGELSADEIKTGLKKAIINKEFVPLMATAAESNVGVSRIIEIISDFYPSPVEMSKLDTKGSDEGGITRKIIENKNTSIFIYKTTNDSSVGDLSYFKVFSGILKPGSELKNIQTNQSERFGTIYTLDGKKRNEVSELHAGDIGVAVKLKDSHTNNTLSDEKDPILFKEIKFPGPVIRVAVVAKSKGDEEKIGVGLSQISEQDPTFHYEVDSELQQTLVSGLGEIHLQASINKIMDRFNIEIQQIEPKIPYRETIRKTTNGRYRHKKQSGGAGQFGEVELQIGPNERGEGIEFESKLVGQNVDRVFVPSIEKGIMQACKNGPLSGNIVIDVKAAVVDGKQHPVDSKDIAFQIAGRESFKKAFINGNPVLLEPIYDIQITVPEEHMGDVMGDISSRRGKIKGMNSDGHFQIINATVPLANLYKYSNILRSLTQGRAYYKRKFSNYEFVPKEVQDKIIENYQKEREEGNK
ncbi:MAG: elongation factor G [Candidatus Marinimicrobia bacterium]|jgi:elongation factor G|nr:elongation factor G [Candidatus Neomarinimicrobiota bacterium]